MVENSIKTLRSAAALRGDKSLDIQTVPVFSDIHTATTWDFQ